MRIFLVEDHDDTREVLRFFFELRGHEVVEAPSIAKALHKLPISECNLLISDVGLPDGYGWDLLKQVELPHPIYAVTMSGFGTDSDRERSLAGGFREHLVKPLEPTVLDAVLGRAMGHTVGTGTDAH